MELFECNPFIRAAMIQPAILEGDRPRAAYDFRLFYVLDGRGYIYINGAERELSPDTLIVLPPREEYYFSGRLKVIVLNFDMTQCCRNRPEPICPPYAERYDESLVFDDSAPDGLDVPVFMPNAQFCRARLSEIVGIFSDRRRQYKGEQVSGTLKALLCEVLCRLGGHTDSLADAVKRYIALHATEGLTVSSVADSFGYNSIYLERVFRRETGVSLHEAIMHERIAAACRWLSRTHICIEEIARETGFSSRSYFCTVFRHMTGMTPLKYREQSTISLD